MVGERGSERGERRKRDLRKCACVMGSRGDAETLRISFPCSSSIPHLLLIPSHQRVRHRALCCLHTRKKEKERNSPSLQRTHIPKPPGNMSMEGQVTFREISRELKPQSSSFPAATTQDLPVSGKPHPACRFGDKPSPLLHLISFPVNYVFIIYSRALLLVTSCCLLLLRAGHVSGSARHSGGLQGWTTGMWWTKTIWDKMKKLVCHWGSHSH